MPGRIVLKIGRGIADHFPVRFSEWTMTYALFGLGWVLWLDPLTFDKTASFAEMARWADERTWALVCMAAAFLRLIALVVNGTFKDHFPYSPHLRGFASLVACTFWGQVTLGIVVSAYNSGGAWTGLVIYSAAMLTDMWNLFRSWADIGSSKAARLREWT
jgi:hypothetical protein